MTDTHDATRSRPPQRYDVENSYGTAEHAPVLTTEEARQGETSGRMRIVLHTSLILAIIAAIVLYAAYF